MNCTEAYKEHIMYTFHGFCKVVIHNAAITAWRDQHRIVIRVSVFILVKSCSLHFPNFLSSQLKNGNRSRSGPKYIYMLCVDVPFIYMPGNSLFIAVIIAMVFVQGNHGAVRVSSFPLGNGNQFRCLFATQKRNIP